MFYIDIFCSCHMPWKKNEKNIYEKQMAECCNCKEWFRRMWERIPDKIFSRENWNMQGRERLGLTRYIPEGKKWARKQFNFSFKWFLKFATKLKPSQNNSSWTNYTSSEFYFEFLLFLRWFNILWFIVYQKLKTTVFLDTFDLYFWV